VRHSSDRAQWLAGKHAANDRDHQLADWRCGIRPRLTQRFELRASLADLVEDVEQITG
jgi:hypothetical protein